MKSKLILIIALTFLPIAMYAQNGIFQKYATRSDVKYVSISHMMLEAMSAKKNVRLGNMSLSSMLVYIDNVLIISSAAPSGMASVQDDLTALREDKQYAALLTKNDRGQRSISLFRSDDEYNEFVLFSLTDNNYTIVVITGHFSPEQFQSFFL